MKVIFIKDVKKQAHKDEIKEVKDGYAKFLISEGLAVPYTSKSANVLDNEIKDREAKEQALIDECNKLKKELQSKKIVFKVKTGAQDRVFGNISTKQISEEFSKMGYDIDKKKITIDGYINSLGTHKVLITLHKKVKFEFDIVLIKQE